MNSLYTMPIADEDSSESRLETSRIQFHNILVATDFSIYARAALDAAIAIARRSGGKLFLLHAAIPPGLYSLEAGMVTPELLQANAEAAEAKMRDFTKHKPELSAIVHREILSSLPVVDGALS